MRIDANRNVGVLLRYGYVAVAVLAAALVWATLRPGRGEGADAPADEPALDGEVDLPIPEPVPSAP